jgi:alpha-aminoadipate/glutamate carrier protein LysW
MATCPVCDGAIDLEQDDVDEGDSLSCDECGAELIVTGTDPLELEPADEEEEDEDDEDFLDEDEEGEDEDEDEEEEEWK